MNSSDTIQSTQCVKVNDECRRARLSLPFELLGELDEDSSFSLFRHLSHCRGCLEAHIALQAAADMACPAQTN